MLQQHANLHKARQSNTNKTNGENLTTATGKAVCRPTSWLGLKQQCYYDLRALQQNYALL
jgi:hypothetical protein